MVFKYRVKYNGIHYPAGVDVPITEAELNGEVPAKKEPVEEKPVATATVVSDTLKTDAFKSLDVKSTASGKKGNTVISVTPTLASGNKYKYRVAIEVSIPTPGQNLRLWSGWDGQSEISAMDGKEICIAEVDSEYRAVRIGTTKVTAKS